LIKQRINCEIFVTIFLKKCGKKINLMEMNKNILLRRAYSRCGIEENAQEGYNRTITYDLETSEITVNLTSKDEVEPKA